MEHTMVVRQTNHLLLLPVPELTTTGSAGKDDAAPGSSWTRQRRNARESYQRVWTGWSRILRILQWRRRHGGGPALCQWEGLSDFVVTDEDGFAAAQSIMAAKAGDDNWRTGV